MGKNPLANAPRVLLSLADSHRLSGGLPGSGSKDTGCPVTLEVQVHLLMLKHDLSLIQPSDIAGRPCVGQLVVPVALVAGPAVGFTLRVPWTAKRSNQSIVKKISPEYSLEGLILKLKLQYFGHLMLRTDSQKRP